MPFDPTKPANATPLNSAEIRSQLNELKALIDAVPLSPGVPVGGIVAWLKSFSGTPALASEFAECNGQVLSDAASPFNGATLPNLNGASGGAQRFLRGATASGGTGGADTHTHGISYFQPTLGDGGSTDQFNILTSDLTTAASSLPSHYEVVWVMRVK